MVVAATAVSNVIANIDNNNNNNNNNDNNDNVNNNNQISDSNDAMNMGNAGGRSFEEQIDFSEHICIYSFICQSVLEAKEGQYSGAQREAILVSFKLLTLNCIMWWCIMNIDLFIFIV